MALIAEILGRDSAPPMRGPKLSYINAGQLIPGNHRCEILAKILARHEQDDRNKCAEARRRGRGRRSCRMRLLEIRSLELEGFSVRAYRSGSELLQATNLEACDCFVVDQKMPDLTGLQLIETLRRREISAPAILVVGRPTAAVAVQAAKDGISIVEKPLLGNVLLAKIRRRARSVGSDPIDAIGKPE